MASKFQVNQLKASLSASNSSFCYGDDIDFRKFRFFARDSYSNRKFRFKLVAQSLGDRWKLNDIDTNAIQERLNSWFSKTQKSVFNYVTSPLVKPDPSRKLDSGNMSDPEDMEDLFMAGQTIDSRTPNGDLSLAAIISIEQFSRMNGLTGKKMLNIFKALVSKLLYMDARNLVEYCCFRFLSRDNSEIHPCLKEPAFQRLIFITMLAWESPYCSASSTSSSASARAFFQGKFVTEEAFIRIAPAVSGVAERSTVHYLFKELAGDEHGISLGVWLAYVCELIKVHEGRKSYKIRELPPFSREIILCLSSSRKRPVLKWENNMAWPGKLTLTDKALYFEAAGLKGPKESIRFDLTRHGLQVKKAKVGPFGFVLFDSAVSISCGTESETWVLEFIDLGGELRRDAWHAFIGEVVALHKFVGEYGPEDDDKSISHVFGAHKGKELATRSVVNSVSRLQALHFMRKLPDDPMKLVQFSYLQSVPYGDIVCQTLAVSYWGGPLVTKVTEAPYQTAQVTRPSEVVIERTNHVTDVDGSVYLQKWMRSPSWSSNASISFWKNVSTTQGLVLSKNLVVSDLNLVERASLSCRQKCQVVEKTQATIDAAMLQGIPSNIDLFKEVILPLTTAAKNFDKLRRWDEPHMTVLFLAFAHTIIFRNLLSYVFPVALMVLAAGMLTLKGLKEQGRLGRSFGKVTIRDQQPSNTIQKIMAVKDAIRDVEIYLQDLNVTLLKIRSIILSGHPQITTEVALVLLSFGTILLIVPFKYVLAYLLCDVFTRELEFRREMVKKLIKFLKERWDTVPAAPVVVLPVESNDSRSTHNQNETEEKSNRKKLQK